LHASHLFQILFFATSPLHRVSIAYYYIKGKDKVEENLKET